MKIYNTDAPEFSESIELFETTDPAHADLFNVVNKKLFENTLYLNNVTEKLLNTETIEAAFFNTFSHVSGAEEDPTALTTEEILDAINTEWNGESSDDQTAMSADEVENAINTEWNGESSDDQTALSAEDIEKATS